MNANANILLVDDDLGLLERAPDILNNQFNLITANSVLKAKKILQNTAIDLVVADLNFDGHEEDGLALIDFISENVPEVEIVVLSADHETSRVVKAMKRKLVDFVSKTGRYGDTLKTAIGLGLEMKRRRSEALNKNVFLTNSAKMKGLLRRVHKIAESEGEFSILITGETGTGKEVLVNYLASLLKKNVTAANMATIPRETAESELFGHIKGAFTGASANKPGLIEQAHHGIFFLDELGECSPQLQAKLLRVIEQKEICPVGDVKNKKIDVRFFAATNSDLGQMIKDKTFRLDLYQRLNTVELKIPPLRERPEDIILYTNYFLAPICTAKRITLTGCAMDALLAYSWPGNIRELKNTCERLVLLADNKTIDGNLVDSALNNQNKDTNTDDILNSLDAEKSKVLKVLARENGNKSRAATELGIDRSTLYRWMDELGISKAFSRKMGRPIGSCKIKEEIIL